MISQLRREYTQAGLAEAEVLPDPLDQFRRWFQEALDAGLTEPNAMVLATVDPAGQPSTRTVLLKAIDTRGFTFFTNYESRKGRELAGNPRAAATFPWIALERQVCVTGMVAKLPMEEAEAYFKQRPRGSRLGALASRQSEPIPNRGVLEERLQQLEEAHPDEDIPKPAAWGGYVLAPGTIEFWQGRPNRLHDRLLYSRQADGTWKLSRLSP